MAEQEAVGVPGARVGGEAGINNPPNMVAEPGAQLPIGGTINGGHRVPIPVGGTPESVRGRRGVDSRSRSSERRVRTRTPLQREPSMNVNPLIFGPQQTPQQAPQQAPQQEPQVQPQQPFGMGNFFQPGTPTTQQQQQQQQ